MSLPTLETCRQLFGDLVRVALQAADADPHAAGDSHGHSHTDVSGAGDSHGHSHTDGSSAGADDGHGHTHGDADGGHGHSHGCASVEGDYMLGLHIAAIFIILVASLIGTLIPLLGKRVPALRLPPYVYAVGKACSTGVVLAVAMIHMINHAAVVFAAECVPESFREMYEGWAFLFAMIAAILMHALDGTIAWIAERWSARAAEQEMITANAAGATEPCNDSLCKDCPTRDAEERQRAEGRQNAKQYSKEDSAEGEGVDAVVLSPCGEDGKREHNAEGAVCQGHQHGVVVPTDMPLAQRVVAAICMEFGVTLHSVFVGLALAVSNGSNLRALIIALVFHQLFEGLAMGARLADASFKLSLEVVLMLVFSFSAPIGIAAGTGAVMASRDAFSGTSYAMVSGVLDSICGGIMLYIAFNLLFVDFAYDIRAYCNSSCEYGVAKRIGLYTALWIGAGVMAVIGKWL